MKVRVFQLKSVSLINVDVKKAGGDGRSRVGRRPGQARLVDRLQGLDELCQDLWPTAVKTESGSQEISSDSCCCSHPDMDIYYSISSSLSIADWNDLTFKPVWLI